MFLCHECSSKSYEEGGDKVALVPRATCGVNTGRARACERARKARRETEIMRKGIKTAGGSKISGVGRNPDRESAPSCLLKARATNKAIAA